MYVLSNMFKVHVSHKENVHTKNNSLKFAETSNVLSTLFHR